VEALEWCDRRLLARIHRATIEGLRREIEPVPAAIFLRFLADWQHATSSTRRRGADGLLEVIEMLQGFEAPVEAWEGSILPARLERYDPDDLERLGLGGQVVWGRLSARDTLQAGAGPVRRGFHRASLITLALRDDLGWLCSRRDDDAKLSSRAAAVRDHLRARGASYPAETAKALRMLPAEIDSAILELVGSGLATLDGFAALRRLAGAAGSAGKRRRRNDAARGAGRFTRRRGSGPLHGEGRLSLLDRGGLAPEEALDLHAAQLLRRYGVLFRDLLARESAAPPWRDLLRVLRRAEARGEVRGGRFVDGFPGEQFALAEAVTALRARRRTPVEDARCEVSAADPLNLAGILIPGERVPQRDASRIVIFPGPAGVLSSALP
jgi:ATP-dependent Lhr-like helicase